MKKIALVFTLFCSLIGITSCNFSTSAKNLEWKDVSSWHYSCIGNPYFTGDNGSIKASVTSGTWSSKISNWVVSNYFYGWTNDDGSYEYEYDSVTPLGFNCDVKVGENMNRAGIEWFTKGAYDQYWFVIYSDGAFEIHFDDVTNNGGWSKILKLSAEESGVKTGKYNNLKVLTAKDESIKIYLNNKLIHTIEAGDFLIEPEKVAVAFQAKKDMTFTEEAPAEAWFKINKFLVEKE